MNRLNETEYAVFFHSILEGLVFYRSCILALVCTSSTWFESVILPGLIHSFEMHSYMYMHLK